MPSFRFRRGPGQYEFNGRALIRLARHLKLATVAPSDTLADGQPQSAAASLAGSRFVDPIEPVEQMR